MQQNYCASKITPSYCQFKDFMKAIVAEYRNIVYHLSVRWLSRGNVLERFSPLAN